MDITNEVNEGIALYTKHVLEHRQFMKRLQNKGIDKIMIGIICDTAFEVAEAQINEAEGKHNGQH